MAELILKGRGGNQSLADAAYARDVSLTVEKPVSAFVSSLFASGARALDGRTSAALLSHRLFILGEQGDLEGLVPDKAPSDIVVLEGMSGKTLSTIAASLSRDEERFPGHLPMISFHLPERDDLGDTPDIMADYRRVVASAFGAVATSLHET